MYKLIYNKKFIDEGTCNEHTLNSLHKLRKSKARTPGVKL